MRQSYEVSQMKSATINLIMMSLYGLEKFFIGCSCMNLIGSPLLAREKRRLDLSPGWKCPFVSGLKSSMCQAPKKTGKTFLLDRNF
jgi:hypothetical protein